MVDFKTYIANIKFYSVWANALLSDGKILFWYTGLDKCHSVNDFYKDFYYAGINQEEYFANHKIELVTKEFIVDESTHNNAFKVLAKEFYKQYEISPDSKGEPAYGL